MNKKIIPFLVHFLFICFHFSPAQSNLSSQDSIPPEDQLKKLKVYTSLPEALKEPEKVRALDLGDQKIKNFPPEIFRFPNLQKLVLNGNELKSLPEEIGRLKNLVWLDLYNNQLSALPNSFGQLQQLIYLDLGWNNFRQIPEEIFELKKLQHLYLYANQLKKISPRIKEIQSLSHLRLGKGLKFFFGGNHLTRLPKEMGEMPHLKELYLPDNGLKSLPPSFSQLDQLKWLDLSNNRFRTIPKEVNEMDSLQVLMLWDRPLDKQSKEEFQKAHPKTRFYPDKKYEGNLWALQAGFQQGKFSVVEFGLMRAFRKDILLAGIGLSGEMNLNDDLWGSKLSFYANGLTIFSTAFHLLYYKDSGKSYAGLRPEVGLGIHFFSLTYGYNVLFSKGSENSNRHLVSFRVILPLAPFFSPFR